MDGGAQHDGGEDGRTAVADTVGHHLATPATAREGNVRRHRTRSPSGSAAATVVGESYVEETEEGIGKRVSTISRHARKRIVNYCPSWPACRYGTLSKRVGRRSRRVPVQNVMDRMIGWSKFVSISIDGMSGTGKSTLARSMNRTYVKINTHCADVTSGSSYNYSPLRALEYMMFHVIYDTKDTPVVWDRCRYANLIFAYVHHLMSVYRDRTMPGPDDDEPILYINNMALSTSLFATVSYVESVCAEKRPVLFIVNSDLRLVAQALLARGGANDVYNAKEYNYQMAQLHVYRYFARLLNAPLVDLNEMFDSSDRTLDEVHAEIRALVDVPERTRDRDLPQPPQRTESIALHAFCDIHDDTMVYQHSTK